MRVLPPEQQRLMQQQIYRDASNGIGFLYGTHMLGSPQRQPTPSLLQQAHQLVNSAPVLDFVKDISGVDNIVCASMQATRYLPGNFLTPPQRCGGKRRPFAGLCVWFYAGLASGLGRLIAVFHRCRGTNNGVGSNHE